MKSSVHFALKPAYGRSPLSRMPRFGLPYRCQWETSNSSGSRTCATKHSQAQPAAGLAARACFGRSALKAGTLIDYRISQSQPQAMRDGWCGWRGSTPTLMPFELHLIDASVASPFCTYFRLPAGHFRAAERTGRNLGPLTHCLRSQPAKSAQRCFPEFSLTHGVRLESSHLSYGCPHPQRIRFRRNSTPLAQ